MHAAIPLYNGFTALDAIGPYTVLAFAPGWQVTFVAAEPGPVTDDQGSLTIAATASYADVPSPDVIVVPGGLGHHGGALRPGPRPLDRARRTSTPAGRPPSAPARSCWARPGC